MPMIFISADPLFFYDDPDDFKEFTAIWYQQPEKGSRDFRQRVTLLHRANETIGSMRNTGFTPLPGRMVDSMGGRMTPVEGGFFHEIVRRVMSQEKARSCRMAAPFTLSATG